MELLGCIEHTLTKLRQAYFSVKVTLLIELGQSHTEPSCTKHVEQVVIVPARHLAFGGDTDFD